MKSPYHRRHHVAKPRGLGGVADGATSQKFHLRFQPRQTPTKHHNNINKMGVTIVLGAQWGDEGKGVRTCLLQYEIKY